MQRVVHPPLILIDCPNIKNTEFHNIIEFFTILKNCFKGSSFYIGLLFIVNSIRISCKNEYTFYKGIQVMTHTYLHSQNKYVRKC